MTLASVLTIAMPALRPAPDAARLHVFRLEPIKARMGEKWEKLSLLVHKLFERTLQQAQAPHDHFLRVDELSYVVSFNRLSLEEASLACAAIAQEVCELLFGEGHGVEVSALASAVPPNLLQAGPYAQVIAGLLDRDAASSAPRAAAPSSDAAWHDGPWISFAHDLAAKGGWKMGFFPVWDLMRRRSASLFAALHGAGGQPLVTRRLLQADPARAVETEIALLNAASAYAHRLHGARQVCAVGAGVSHETLSGFHSRIRYIGALKAAPPPSACPLLIRIEDIPDGTPPGRLAEIVAMISLPNVRVALEFRNPRSLEEFDVRMGAAGLGATLAPDTTTEIVTAIAGRLMRRGTEQKCFTFLHGLSTQAQLAAAVAGGIRAGAGTALSQQRLTGLEAAPALPLTAEVTLPD